MTRPYSLGLVVLHPVPYQVPFYRALAHQPRIDPLVIYLDDMTLRGVYVPEFRTTVRFTDDLLRGYPHVFTRNLSSQRAGPLLSRVNPGLIPIVCGHRFDAVMVTGYNHVSAYFALSAAKLCGSKVLLRAEADLSKASRPTKAWAKNAILPHILRQVDAVMYSCRRNREYFLHYGVPSDRLFPVLSSVDNAGLSMKHAELRARRSRIRSELGIPERACVALFVGRLTERKCVMDLLVAARDLLKTRDDFRLLYVGDGPLYDDLTAAALAWGIGDRVVFTGFQTDTEVPRFMAASDIFVLPSSYDPTPKSVNEAMVCGLPVIVAAGVGTAGDLVREAENGFVFPTHDVRALGEIMARLLDDESLRARLGEAGKRTVHDWSPEANAEGVLKALRHVCGDRK